MTVLKLTPSHQVGVGDIEESFFLKIESRFCPLLILIFRIGAGNGAGIKEKGVRFKSVTP